MFELFTDDEVKQALEELPENFRLPVLLADVEGFAYKEIAEMLDIPVGTVMSRLHRGRKQMHKLLFDFASERGLHRVNDIGIGTCLNAMTTTATTRCENSSSSSTRSCRDGAKETIHAHLDGCPDCLQAFDFHAELKTVIATKCRNDEMPPGLLQQDRAVLRRRQRRHRTGSATRPSSDGNAVTRAGG